MALYGGIVYKRLLFNNALLKKFKRCCSALYIVGNKATETCAIVNPHINLEDCLKRIDSIEENIKKRQINVKLDQFKELAQFFMTVDKIKQSLNKHKDYYRDALAKFDEKQDGNIEKLKIQSQVVMNDLRNLKHALWNVEEEVMTRVLSFPNELHSKTPESESIIENYKDNLNKVDSDSHLNIGSKLNLLNYSSPYNYYLKNEAAMFELQAKFFFSKHLRNKGYVQFSNPDFVKSTIIEGCGLDHTNSDEVFILHHNENTPIKDNRRLHLTGGSSIYSYAAYFMRNIIRKSSLPLRYYCFGRQYKPVPEDSKLGLYEVSQASAIEIFAGVHSDETLDQELNKIASDISDIYKQIDYPFKVCYIPASKLQKWESLRVSFQMYSPFYKRYIEVGNVSVSDDYISKRLQIYYSDKEDKQFLKIISGTVLHLPKLIGFTLEFGSDTKFSIPNVFEDVF